MNKTVFCFTLLFMAAGMHLPFHTNIDHYSQGKEKQQGSSLPALGGTLGLNYLDGA